MEVEAVTHSQALGQAPGVQLKRGREDHMPDIVDSSRKAFIPMRSERGWEDGGGGTEKGREGELGLVCKMKDIFSLRKKKTNEELE